jgi:hypothetical protein
VTAFIYTAWFRDPDCLPDDQDYEWCACFSINATSAERAQAWGDFLARRRHTSIRPDIFLNSSVAPNDGTYEMVSLSDGEDVTDEFIGW